MKNYAKFITVVLLLSGLITIIYLVTNKEKEPNVSEISSTYKDALYTIAGEKVRLKDGVSISPTAPGSATSITTKYFGNEVGADFNGDGKEDVAFLLTQNTGGSGTFYYVVAALNTERGYVGSEGIFLGDRIAPQTTELKDNNVIVVNYAERKPGESFAEQPSIGKSIWLKLDPATLQFGEVAQNFEGESDPNRMKLTMKTWNWISTEYNSAKTVTPKVKDKFTITFKADGSFSATTDCNSAGGQYGVIDMGIKFDKIFSTLMACDNSQEADFLGMLQASMSYQFTSKGELVLKLENNKGSMFFK